MKVYDEQIRFFKNRIIDRINSLRDYISDVKYRLYISMIEECNSYEDIKQLSELDLQIDLFKYIKDIKDRLEEYDTNINELNAVCDKTHRASQMIVLSRSKRKKDDTNDVELTTEDIQELMEDDEATNAMAMMLSMYIQNQPLNEKYREQILEARELTDNEGVSIYEIDRLDTSSLESIYDSEEDEEEDELDYIDDFDSQLIEEEDYEDEEDDSEDEEDDDSLGIDFSSVEWEEDTENDKPKQSLDNFIPNFNLEAENEDDIIDLNSPSNTLSFVENTVDNGDSDNIDSISMDDLFMDEDEEDYIDEEESNDNNDIDTLEFAEFSDEYDKDEEMEEGSDETTDEDSMFDSLNYDEDEYDDDAEDETGGVSLDESLDSIDIEDIADEYEEDTNDNSSDSIDSFDIEDINFDDEFEDRDTSDEEYLSLFGGNSASTSNTEAKTVKREITLDKIFINGTDRGRKTQDMLLHLDKIFTGTEKVVKSASRGIRSRVSGG